MDVVELVYTFLFFVLAIAFIVLIMWYNVPENKAYLLRRLKKKNYVVVTIRHGGGQLREHVVCVEPKKGEDKPPTFTIGDREYIPIEKVTRNETVRLADGREIEREITDSIVNFKSSVPVYFYNYDDAKPVALSGVDVEKKFRNPALLNMIFLQAQALYRTKVAKEIAMLMKTVQSWDLRFWIILGASVLAVIIGIFNIVQIQQVNSTVIQVGTILNQTITSSIPNQFPYG